MSALAVLWFALVAVLICGYFVLDGFDLGIGVLYPALARSERDRAVLRRAVGPVWDGNEVWLLTAGGALFAAFPAAYATSFSGFYLAVMLVLFGLIMRATSLEFRGHDPEWKGVWDVLFFVGSLLPALLLGVAIGNVVQGIPLNENGDYTGTFFGLLRPFPLLCGVLGLVHMMVQGASWAALKSGSDSEMRTRAQKMRSTLVIVELVVFVLASVLFFAVVVPNSAVGLAPTLLGWVFALAYLAVTVLSQVAKGDLGRFVLASAGCAALVGVVASTLFPYLIPATDAAMSITVGGAASSDLTLTVMTVIACIGVPIVLVYHVLAYRIFRGRLEDEGELTY